MWSRYYSIVFVLAYIVGNECQPTDTGGLPIPDPTAFLSFSSLCSESMSTIGYFVAYCMPVLFVVRVCVWYCFRYSVATFGSGGVDHRRTRVEYKARQQGELKHSFLANSYFQQLGEHDVSISIQKEYKTKFKQCGCCPVGEHALNIGPHHIEVEKTEGCLGIMMESQALTGRDNFSIMSKNIKWLHVATSGRSLWKLLKVCMMLLACCLLVVSMIGSGASVPGSPTVGAATEIPSIPTGFPSTSFGQQVFRSLHFPI